MATHASFDEKNISLLNEKCEGINKEYLLQDLDEETASFKFVANIDGKPAAIDAFLYTLELEFYEGIYEAAKDAVVDTEPKFANANFEEEDGPHIELLEEIIKELTKDDDFSVQEFIVTGQEEGDDFTLMEICLNVEEVNEELIKEFVVKFKAGNFELDKTFYSFSK
ncbi:hypothetical protein R9C00_16355 [Flammeovirgaceae bacterium SG7u.111]|nr:hypothetical protein [Flammeovirgaceae bacterium SG7u.132]WPO33276.1 hypothetical protein R9C00_16355 [Flammeovirgaceae bacterium SG7u.111]